MMLILAMFTVGLWTRVTSFLSLVVVISFVNRVPEALFGLDKMNAIFTFYLTVGPSGRALSLDCRLAQRRRGRQPSDAQRSVGTNFALRLIQVHMCIIYFFAGISKLQGAAWWNGEAMWLAFGNLEYQSADMTWLAWHPWIVHFLNPFHGVLGDLILCAHLGSPATAARDRFIGRHAPGDRCVPRLVDVFADDDARLRSVFAHRSGRDAGGGTGLCPRTTEPRTSKAMNDRGSRP